jgi:hypothetical protein
LTVEVADGHFEGNEGNAAADEKDAGKNRCAKESLGL